MSRVKKTHCSRGHEIAVIGRYKSGNCRACSSDLNATPKKKAENRAYNASLKGKTCFRKNKLKRKYGLTIEAVEQMHKDQKGLCLICGKLPFSLMKQNQKLHIDHSHKTNVVRGMLCYKCNHGLGNFNDSPDLLRTAASYLERF